MKGNGLILTEMEPRQDADKPTLFGTLQEALDAVSLQRNGAPSPADPVLIEKEGPDLRNASAEIKVIQPKIIEEKDMDRVIQQEIDRSEAWLKHAVAATKKSCTVFRAQENFINESFGSRSHSSRNLVRMLPNWMAGADDFRVISESIKAVSIASQYKSRKELPAGQKPKDPIKTVEDFLDITGLMDYDLNWIINCRVIPSMAQALFQGQYSVRLVFEFNRMEERVLGMYNVKRIISILESRKFKCSLEQNKDNFSEHFLTISWFGAESGVVTEFEKIWSKRRQKNRPLEPPPAPVVTPDNSAPSSNEEEDAPSSTDINSDEPAEEAILKPRNNSQDSSSEEEILVYTQ